MQLILESETTEDIRRNMSTHEISVDEKFVTKDIIQDLKNEFLNGNKENANDNVILDTEENLHLELEKENVVEPTSAQSLSNENISIRNIQNEEEPRTEEHPVNNIKTPNESDGTATNIQIDEKQKESHITNETSREKANQSCSEDSNVIEPGISVKTKMLQNASHLDENWQSTNVAQNSDKIDAIKSESTENIDSIHGNTSDNVPVCSSETSHTKSEPSKNIEAVNETEPILETMENVIETSEVFSSNSNVETIVIKNEHEQFISNHNESGPSSNVKDVSETSEAGCDTIKNINSNTLLNITDPNAKITSIKTKITDNDNAETTVNTNEPEDNISNENKDISSSGTNVSATTDVNSVSIKDIEPEVNRSNENKDISSSDINVSETTDVNSVSIRDIEPEDNSYNENKDISSSDINLSETTDDNSVSAKDIISLDIPSNNSNSNAPTTSIKAKISDNIDNVYEKCLTNNSIDCDAIIDTKPEITQNIENLDKNNDTNNVTECNVKKTETSESTENLDKTCYTETNVKTETSENLDKSSDSHNAMDCDVETNDPSVASESAKSQHDNSIKFNNDTESNANLENITKIPKHSITSDVIDCDAEDEVVTCVNDEATNSTDNIMDVDSDEVKKIDEEKVQANQKSSAPKSKTEEKIEPLKISPICKLSNTLDILSDDEEDTPNENIKINESSNSTEKQCINIDDDDDIMLIEEDTNSKDSKDTDKIKPNSETKEDITKCSSTSITFEESKDIESTAKTKESGDPQSEQGIVATSQVNEKISEVQDKNLDKDKPLVAENLLKTCKKNIADMTRDDLEEFCLLKIAESIIDRSNLSETKSTLKTMAQSIEEYKKKAMMLTKQNRDLQVVLKSIQEEQKKKGDTPITPLKITRSVGMQVLMSDKVNRRKGGTFVPPGGTNNSNNNAPVTRSARGAVNQGTRPQKTANNQQIPVPRLVPAATNTVLKSPSPLQVTVNNGRKTNSPVPNGVRNSPTTQKSAEKRPHSSKAQSQVTVDLTDDEPPTKMAPRNVPIAPVRVVPPQNLLAPQRQPFGPSANSPRKVYIPISGPQAQNIRGTQAIMLKSVQAPMPRGVPPPVVTLGQNPVRMEMRRMQGNRHPAPLPDAKKQFQPPNWKALPPAPDLKLSKVENGIVISWKIEGYQEDSYEEIASYQLYAYQETSSPPNTSLWKKIGDVKALPLPMACTLTQFMAGYKYYFAVRAVDVRSRLGPFSLPGSILLLNKM